MAADAKCYAASFEDRGRGCKERKERNAAPEARKGKNPNSPPKSSKGEQPTKQHLDFSPGKLTSAFGILEL